MKSTPTQPCPIELRYFKKTNISICSSFSLYLNVLKAIKMINRFCKSKKEGLSDK